MTDLDKLLAEIEDTYNSPLRFEKSTRKDVAALIRALRLAIEQRDYWLKQTAEMSGPKVTGELQRSVENAAILKALKGEE